MRILIGTPVNKVKDYCMEKWLVNVNLLQKHTNSDLLLIDNSIGNEYTKRLTHYCKKIGITNVKIEHFEIKNGLNDLDKTRAINIEVSQEIIRQRALSGNYDVWFSWECDQIIPVNSLEKMIQIMLTQKSMMVIANSWARSIAGELNTNMGVTLISRDGLNKAWFLPFKKGELSFDASDFYNVDETIFKKRILKNGGNYIEIFGVIDPIYHLNK